MRGNGPAPDGSPCPNFAVQLIAVDGGTPRTLVGHREDATVTDVEAFAGHAVVSERAQGLERIRIVDLQTGDQHVVEQPEPVYATGGGLNPEFDTELFRFTYTSLVSPPSTVDYEIATRRRTVVKTATRARRLRRVRVPLRAAVGDRRRRHAGADLARRPVRRRARRPALRACCTATAPTRSRSIRRSRPRG